MKIHAFPIAAAILALAACNDHETAARRAPEDVPATGAQQRTQADDTKLTVNNVPAGDPGVAPSAAESQRTQGDRDKLEATGAPAAAPERTPAVEDPALRGAAAKPAKSDVGMTPAPVAEGSRPMLAPAPAAAPVTESAALPSRTAADRADASRLPADDSGRNRREDGTAPTPLDQGTSQGDIDITSAIRRRVVDREDLSVNAKNVKIITRDGVVTLRGPVADARERDTLLEVVLAQRGVERVDNQLDLLQP